MANIFPNPRVRRHKIISLTAWLHWWQDLKLPKILDRFWQINSTCIHELRSTGFPRNLRGLRSLKIFIIEYQNNYFEPKTSLNRLKRAVFPRYSRFLSPRIVKTANNKGRLYTISKTNENLFGGEFWMSKLTLSKESFVEKKHLRFLKTLLEFDWPWKRFWRNLNTFFNFFLLSKIFFNFKPFITRPKRPKCFGSKKNMKESISPTFYAHLLVQKFGAKLFCTYILGLNFFWRQNIGAIALIKCWRNWLKIARSTN